MCVCVCRYAKVGHVERAVYLLEDMMSEGIIPCTVTYNSMIFACSRSSYYAHKAWEFYFEMQDQYDYAPVRTFMNLCLFS